MLLALVFYDSQRLLDLVYFAYSIRGSLFIVLLLAIYWKGISERAAVYAMWTTGAVGLFWVIYKNIIGSYPIFPQFSETYAAVIAALGVTLAGSMFTGKTGYKKPEKRIKKKTDIERGELKFKFIMAWVYVDEQKIPSNVDEIRWVGGVVEQATAGFILWPVDMRLFCVKRV